MLSCTFLFISRWMGIKISEYFSKAKVVLVFKKIRNGMCTKDFHSTLTLNSSLQRQFYVLVHPSTLLLETLLNGIGIERISIRSEEPRL